MTEQSNLVSIQGKAEEKTIKEVTEKLEAILQQAKNGQIASFIFVGITPNHDGFADHAHIESEHVTRIIGAAELKLTNIKLISYLEAKHSKIKDSSKDDEDKSASDKDSTADNPE